MHHAHAALHIVNASRQHKYVLEYSDRGLDRRVQCFAASRQSELRIFCSVDHDVIVFRIPQLCFVKEVFYLPTTVYNVCWSRSATPDKE